MPTPTEEVLTYFEEWTTVEAMIASMQRRFTPETVWENVGMSRTLGAEEAIGFTQLFFGQLGVARGEVIVDHIAAVGNVVLTERTDIFYGAGGTPVLSIKLMGVLEMDGPNILAWRDYFDTKAFAA